MEEFRDIPGYEGLYQVSNLGRVKSLKRTIIKSNGVKQNFKERILKNNTDKQGYCVLMLCSKYGQKTHSVHRLVAVAFLGHTPNGTNKIVVDHIDNNRTNNDVNNLQLITNRENLSKDKKGTSKHTGVSWFKERNKWMSRIYINGKLNHLGMFSSEEEAGKAYQDALLNL